MKTKPKSDQKGNESSVSKGKGKIIDEEEE